MTKRIFCPECDGIGLHIERFVNHDGTICEHTTKCETCNGERYITVPFTNADRIRAMSDEELAEWAINKAPSIGKRYTDSRLGVD